MMTISKRRRFLKTSGLGLLAASHLSRNVFSAPSTRVRHAVIGLGNQGRAHCRTFSVHRDLCEVVAVCDLDPKRRERSIEEVLPNGNSVKLYEDYREIWERDDIDSVSIATPDHWHAKIAVEAAKAGKHVYVEKPCCHNLTEGRALLEAEMKYNVCMQQGTQKRSDQGAIKGIEFLRSGEFDQVRMAKAINHQLRGPIGTATPEKPPEGVNYDLWLGPAAKHPFTQNRWHYNWHWFWDYGTGDMGNDGIHQVDVARWGLGVEYPKAVNASGGQLFYQDDHQTPDTQMVTFEYEDCYLVYEMRLWTDYKLEGHDNATVFYCDEGRVDLGRDYFAIHKDGKRIDFEEGNALKNHIQNFLECIVNDAPEKLNAPMREAVPSAALCHLGNIATRVKQRLEYDPDTNRFHSEEANALVSREYREEYGFPEV